MIGEDTKKDGRTNGTVETFHETSLQNTRYDIINGYKNKAEFSSRLISFSDWKQVTEPQ